MQNVDFVLEDNYKCKIISYFNSGPNTMPTPNLQASISLTIMKIIIGISIAPSI